VLILAGYDEIPEVEILRHRDCEVWFPGPQDVLLGTHLNSHPRSTSGWLDPTLRAARNAMSLSLETRNVSGGDLAKAVEFLQVAEKSARGQECQDDITGFLGRI